MAVPQTLSFEELQDILNVAAPTGISAPSIMAAPPMLPTPQTAGSSIAYIARPSFTQAYSPENLPEFMKDFEQISPTLFAPSQGVFAQAPEVDTIQPLMPQQYVDEYADLERAFQESIALDPTMFGGGYRSGLYMPIQTLPAREGDGVFDIAESLAAVAGLRELYPYAEEAVQKAYDPVEETVQQKALDPAEDAFKVVADPTEEFIQQILLDPAEDVAKIPLKEVEKLLPEIDVNIDYKTISEILSGEPAPEAVPEPTPEPAPEPAADPVEEVVQQVALDPAEDLLKVVGDPTEEFIQQIVLDPAENVVKIPLKEVEKVLPEVDVNVDYKTISEILSGEPTPEPAPEPTPEPAPEPAAEPVVDISLPTESIDKIINDVVFDPIKEATEPQIEIIKESIVNPILEVAPEVDVNFETQTLSEIIENLIKEEPKLVEERVEKVAETQVEQLKDSGIIDFSDGKLDINITLPKIPVPDTLKEIVDNLGSGTTNVVEAYANIENLIENPSGRNVDKAVQVINNVGFDVGATAPVVPPAVGEALSYAADIDAIINAFEDPDAESLTNAYVAADDLMATSGGLPAGEAIGEMATIFTGLEALDGGIESAADAVNVLNAANAAAGLAGVTTGVGAGATAGFLPPNVTAALGPIGAILSAPSIMRSITSLAEGGAAGTYERIQGEFDLKDGRFAVGGGVRAADTGRKFGDKYAQETMNSGVSMANSLVDDYGFEIDEQALKSAPKNIMNLQTSGYYLARNMKGASVGADDFVVKMLQNGVLKPTENTPPEILASNEAFASFVTDHLNKGRDEYAAKMYTDTGGTGVEYGSKPRNQGLQVKQRAKFASQDAAQSWADDNKTDISYDRERVGRFNSYYKKQITYDVMPVKVGDRTYYELKKNNIKEKISRAEYDKATKA